MQIDLSDVISTDYKEERFEVPIGSEIFDMGPAEYPFTDRKPLIVTARNEGNRTVCLSGHLDVTLDVPCDRCLTSVPVRFDSDFSYEVDFSKPWEDIDEFSFIEGSSLDVDSLVHNEILVHFPPKVLCRDDCRGLCVKCGANLNFGDCGCDRTSSDPRMSAIQDIFNNFKEV